MSAQSFKFIFSLFVYSVLVLSFMGSPLLYAVPLDSEFTNAQYKKLESVSPRSSDFFDAFEELQKIHYSEGQWNRFFGYAIYFRRNFLAHKESFHRHFRQRPLSLEVMALGKHCQWERARTLALRSLGWAKELNIPAGQTDEIQGALDHVNLLAQYPDLKVAPKDLEAPKVVFDSRALWSIPVEDISRIRHPKNIRVHVKNMCPSKLGEKK